MTLRLAVFVAATALVGPISHAHAQQQVGVTSAVLNDVRIGGAGAASLRPAVLRQRVAIADQVQTGQRSQLQVMLLDRSVFTVGANARLTIDRFVYDPATGRSVGASVAKGAFRFMSGRNSRGRDSAITTPVATIGIRGTILDGVVGADAVAIASGERIPGGTAGSDPATATLVVLRGPGQRTESGATRGEITVSAGGKDLLLDRPMLASYVPRSGAQPSAPFLISLSGLARLQGLIFPSLAEWAAATLPPAETPYPLAPPRQVRGLPPRGGFPDGDFGGSAPGVPGYGIGIPGMPQDPMRPAGSMPRQPPAGATDQRPTATTPPPPQEAPPLRSAAGGQEQVPAPKDPAPPPRSSPPAPPAADMAPKAPPQQSSPPPSQLLKQQAPPPPPPQQYSQQVQKPPAPVKPTAGKP